MKSMFKGALGALIMVLALSGLTAASAFASGAPVVETKPATSITGSEAELNGHVNPNGAGTKFRFEYGTTTSYGSNTLESGESTTEKTVFRHVEGLAPNTTYHFRIVAKNTFGTSDGADETFTTPAEKPEFAKSGGGTITEVKWSGSFGGATWGVPAGKEMYCGGQGSFQGNITGPKTIVGKLLFQGCNDGSYCLNEGAKERNGEIHTEELEGTLEYLSKTAKTVGIVLKPKTAALFVSKFRCFYSGEVRGSLILPWNGALNTPVSKMYVGGLREKEGVQETREYENSTGGKIAAALETTWPSSETFKPLGWGIAGFAPETNKQFEVKA
jgi:hypothetical protein